MEAVGEEGDKDMRLDALLVLVKDRADGEVAFETDYQEFRARLGGSALGHGPCEALAEEDGELGLGHAPLARRHNPRLLGAVQDKEEEFGRGLVAGEILDPHPRLIPHGQPGRAEQRDLALTHFLCRLA
jgi:hypothetical protein